MKSTPVVLLLVSLAGNIALGFYVFRQNSSTAAPTVARAAAPEAAALSVVHPAQSPSVPSTAPVGWQALKPGPNLHDLVANLRAAGFPPSVVRAVVSQMVAERLSGPGMDDLPFWKKNFNNPEYRAAQEQLNVDRRNLLTDLLGPDARPSAMMDPVSRERRYGSLSDEKIDQIETINRDFSEMRTKLLADRKPGDTQNLMAVQAGLEQELRKDLAAALTPAELEQYELRSSSAANRVMSNLRSVDVNEAEFTALFRAQKAYDTVNPIMSGTITTDVMALRNTAQSALNEQARAILTDDRFYEYLLNADSAYARNSQFTAKYPAITPAMTYALTQLEREYQSNMMTMSRGGSGASQADRMAQLSAVRKDYEDKVNAMLGAETAAAYMKRNVILPSTRPGP